MGVKKNEKKQRTIFRDLILLSFAFIIIWVLYSNSKKDEMNVLAIGDEAPNFKLTDLNGQTHMLSDYKEKAVMLNFWGTWCGPCAREMPAIEKQYQLYKDKDKDFEIISINLAQSKLEVENFTNKYNLTFPVTIDKTNSVSNAYNVVQLPATIFIDKEGKINKIVKGELDESSISKFIENILPTN
ncbi:thiol-disulfide oxidoreductase ResA [Bacillus sp. FJAT-53060]|uniref:thiol-disulfide oxidoreductase ResA n=1 Tax=Bacillus sp. FJAT-53060 TaxID=3127666 RepID=UPI003013645F